MDLLLRVLKNLINPVMSTVLALWFFEQLHSSEVKASAVLWKQQSTAQ